MLPNLTFPDRLSTEVREAVEDITSQLHRTLLGDETWITVPYDPSNFRGDNAMIWTVNRGDQVTYQYSVTNTTMRLNAYLDTTSISGTPDLFLFLKIPGGYRAATKVQTLAPLFDNGTGTVAFARVNPDSDLVEIARLDLAALTASTRNTYVRCMMQFEIQR
jgi:hypothetical protein